VTDWKSFPKLELHCHLEGAAPPDLVRRMGAEQGIDLTGLFDADGTYNSSDFSTFLAAYEQMSKVFAKPESYRQLTEAVLAEQAKNGVIYSEIFLSPTSLGYDAGQWEEMLAAIEEGADEAETTYGIICRFIPVIIRHHGPEKASAAAAVMRRASRGRMTGFGIAGDERQFQCADFSAVFADMKEAHFRLTAHAGEWGGPESVRDALDILHVERVGHGVRAIEDPLLVARLAETQITLEVCPGSNVALGVYPDLANHPVKRLCDAGCAVTISTDDPPFFHTTMTDEYANLEATFDMDAKQFRLFGDTAIDAAFCEDETKAILRGRLKTEGSTHD
jgi:adenosine deaminase